jgi:membrane-bound lytic murein transglycosylase C
MDQQIDSQFGAAAKEKEQSEFEEWKVQQAKEYEDYKRAYFEALHAYIESIGEHWDQAEVTDKKIWVEYSDDLQTKRVVDFESNEIRISLLEPSVDNEKIEKLVETNLLRILKETPNDARKSDPVLEAVGSTEAGKDKQSNLAILSELFEETPQTIQEKAAELVKKAVVERPKRPQGSTKTQPVIVTIKLPKNSIAGRATKYEALVRKNAATNKLDPSLVFAIMHTESAFNPMARSHIPAYGLMQIVPESAGLDVAKRLYGKEQIFSADYLFDAANNVQAGATYINILYFSYLKGVQDPLSRLYCVIAAYNTGSGNVAKSFNGDRNLRKALPTINSMSPAQVYDTLIQNLPFEETRNYLKRVVERQGLYTSV